MAKRISSSSIKWDMISGIIAQDDIAVFNAFKNKSDKFLKRVAAQPAELPKIDWSYYQARISVPGMVDNYKKSYESLKIPYPPDQGLLAKVDQQLIEHKKTHQKNMEAIKKDISDLQQELKKLESVLPYSEMNLEEFFTACPEQAISLENIRKFPHEEEDTPTKPKEHH